MTQARREKVMAAIRDIRQFYRDGRQIPPKQPHGEGYGLKEIEKAAARLGMNIDTARKARQFVARETGYSRKDLDELCSLLKRVQPNQDENRAIFGRTHVIRLLAVASKRERRALQRQAIEEGWSLTELGAEIARRYGTRRPGGRRRRIAGDPTACLTQLEAACETWRRMYRELTRPTEDNEEGEQSSSFSLLPQPIQTHLSEASASVRRLQQTVTAELTERQPGREVRRVFEDESAEETDGSGEQRQRPRKARGSRDDRRPRHS